MTVQCKYGIVNRLITEGKITLNEARILLDFAPISETGFNDLMILESKIEKYSNQQ